MEKPSQHNTKYFCEWCEYEMNSPNNFLQHIFSRWHIESVSPLFSTKKRLQLYDANLGVSDFDINQLVIVGLS